MTHSPAPAIQVAVCGDGSPETPYADAARRAGRLLAEAGAVVLTGGMAGVMAAATDGAREAGGITVAVLPGGSPGSAIAEASVRLATGAGEARNVMLVRSAAAVIAIGGGHGTLSEIATARKLGIPVFGYRTWQAQAPTTGEPLVADHATVEDAVAAALAAARRA